MIGAFVTEAIGDRISLPVKLLLRTTFGHAGRKALTLTSGCFLCASASIDAIKRLGGCMNRHLQLVAPDTRRHRQFIASLVTAKAFRFDQL
jgi:hypothetical protein